MMVRRFGAAVIGFLDAHRCARAARLLPGTREGQRLPGHHSDGPRGPRFRFKPGALLLAQMSGRPILPMSYAASRAWLIKWDKFVIPMPFSRIAIAIGPPAMCRGSPTRLLTRLQSQMEQELKRLYGVARAACSRIRTDSVKCLKRGCTVR